MPHNKILNRCEKRMHHILATSKHVIFFYNSYFRIMYLIYNQTSRYIFSYYENTCNKFSYIGREYPIAPFRNRDDTAKPTPLAERIMISTNSRFLLKY